MILETLCLGPMQVNCYIVASSPGEGAVIIDPGYEKEKIDRALKKYSLKPTLIINTHGHIDHIGCDDKFGVPVYIHQEDSALLENPALNLSASLASPFSVKSDIKTLEDKDIIDSGQIRLEVIHVPGHTPGGIALLMKKPEDKVLFTGDSLFYHGVGRTDFTGASESLLIKSIKERLLKLSDDILVYPGHGPSSTIGEERKNNPFL
ncbi:MAG: MBL fold metallo-hydrolase [Candidatus Omnitrophota bacterium]